MRPHELEVIDCDGRMFCARCGATASEDLEKSCRAPSDEALARDELQAHIYGEEQGE